MLVVLRGGFQESLRDVGVELGFPGTDDLGDPPGRLGSGGYLSPSSRASLTLDSSTWATATCFGTVVPGSSRLTAHQSARVGTAKRAMVARVD
jgi:hypothetical protein